MLSLSAAAILEKNALANAGAWIILLEVVIGSSTLRFCYNNEDVTWNGETWIAFPFDIEDVGEDSQGEFPAVQIRVGNVTRAVQYYVEQADGAVGSSVTLRIVHSEHLDQTTPEIEEAFAVTKTVCDAQYVSFTLGGAYPITSRRPARRFLKNFCPFQYKGVECAATSAATDCDHSLAACKARSNSGRFGGEPAIPMGGLYASL